MRPGRTTLPGFMHPSGSQTSLNCSKAWTSVGTEHDGEKLSARLAVSVLTGDRPSHGHNQLSGFVGERTIPADPVGGGEVEIEPVVDAAPTEVAVDGGPVAGTTVELEQSAQVIAEPVGSDGRVLPAGPGDPPIGQAGSRPEGGLAHSPQHRLMGSVGHERRRRRRRRPGETADEAPGLAVGFVLVGSAHLDEEPCLALGQGVDAARVEVGTSGVVDEAVVEAFQADGRRFQQLGNMVPGAAHVGVAEGDHRTPRGVLDQGHLGLEHGDAGSLGADQGASHVEAVLGEQLVEVVAGDPSRDVGVPAADLLGVGVSQDSEAMVDLAATAAGGDDRFQLVVRRGTHVETLPVVGEDIQADDVVRRPPGHQ